MKDVILYVCIVTVTFAFVLLVRNQMVFKYRMALLNQIYIAATEAINRTDATSTASSQLWRYDEFRSVSYDAMVMQFWRRRSSFYDRWDFIDPDGKPREVGDDA